MKHNTIYKEDCIQGMKKIKDGTVQIIIADPPYNIGKNFGNNSDKQDMKSYFEWCKQWIDECLRILADDGTMYIYGFSEILAYIEYYLDPLNINDKKCNVRWVIWHYTNKTVPTLNFWQRSHESILVCYKESKVFNRDKIREAYTEGYLNGSAGKKRPGTKGRFGDKETVYKAHADGALPRDVIKIPTLAGGSGKNERVDHPTQKPLNLCEKLLKACKNPNNNLLVVPFCGSGSECVAAKLLDIDFIAFEINADYIKIANTRLKNKSEQDQLAETMGTLELH